MLNKRQIAKKRNDIRYRDELVRRDQIRQAHYLKLREQRTEEQKAKPAEPVAEVDVIDEVKQEIQADEAVEVKPVVIKRVVPTRRKKAKGPRIPAESVPLKESDAEPLYFTRLRKKGWYDVFGPEGQVTITAKRLKVAEEMVERMNNGLGS